MTNCKYCKIENNLIYEDNIMLAFLKEKPCTSGHIIIVPKEHFTIMEQVPNEIIGKMFDFSNILSGILFEVMQIQGTNIIINNGFEQDVPHFSINILPRTEKDDLNFNFKPLKFKDDQIDVIMHNIKKGLKGKEKAIEEKKPKLIDNKKSSWIEKTFIRIP